MQTPVIIVIGPPHHGKTEARKALAELTFQKGESTSTVIYHFLAARRKQDVKELHALPKDDIRPELIEAGDFMVGKINEIKLAAENPEVDQSVYRIPSALVRTLYLNGYNIIDGVRRRPELQDSIRHLEWNGVRTLVLWIERPGADTVQDNTELTQADAHEVVYNDGTLEDLKVKLKAVLEKYFGKQPEKHDPLPVFDNEGNVVPPGPKVAERTSEL